MGYTPRGCKQSDTTEPLHFQMSLTFQGREGPLRTLSFFLITSSHGVLPPSREKACAIMGQLSLGKSSIPSLYACQHTGGHEEHFRTEVGNPGSGGAGRPAQSCSHRSH